jgi:hypothetical protein
MSGLKRELKLTSTKLKTSDATPLQDIKTRETRTRKPTHQGSSVMTSNRLKRVLSISATIVVTSLAAQGVLAQQSTGLSRNDDMNAPANSTRLMPNAPLGSEYPTHGNQQAGELNLNPTDPRAQLVNGLPNNSQSGGYGSPLAGNKANVPVGY